MESTGWLRKYGFVSISPKNGTKGRTLHKSIDCLSLRWSDSLVIGTKKEANKLRKCKLCFPEELKSESN
jgi:hypothetical protein